MSKEYSLKNDGSFIIKNYNKMPPFSNFLPGVAGKWGIPLWVFYVNRAQGVVSFGVNDKDHAISEFLPANKAYSSVPFEGFRTFVKINGRRFYEPFKNFSDCGTKEEMRIKSASFEIKEVNLEEGVSFSVRYFTLPAAFVGGLVRVVTVKNISKKKSDLEIIDGLARIIPFGSINPFLKDISRTLEAWMHSSVENNLATFRLIVDPRDVSHTKYIEGANFNYSFFYDKGTKKHPYLIVDPVSVFSQNTSYSCPVNFLKDGFKTPLNQISCGRTPCSFSHFKWTLAPGEEKVFYSIFGSAPKPELINKIAKIIDESYLNKKECENEDIIGEIKNDAFCVSGLKEFDHYVKGTYLDNVLRGGYPYCAQNAKSGDDGKNNFYYIFSRKHGDLERDYNYFQLHPSYFSEGESNYRDVNQNRRMDLFFYPYLGYKNITYFLNFIKMDGYNPLVIKGEKLFFSKEESSSVLQEFGIKDQRASHLLTRGFYLGEVFKLLEEEQIEITRKEELASALLSRACREPQANHGEGYWVDHWRYNLDLIESFQYFYPDKINELFLDNSFVFWDDEHRVKRRALRYISRGGSVYQGESIEVVKEKRAVIKERNGFKNFLRTEKGEIYKTNLTCKLLTLILNKAATLDPEGIGIEMEADKPGWCDSLNGLPALFGSSLCETFELKRAVLMLLSAVDSLNSSGINKVTLPSELFLFFNRLNRLLNNFFSTRAANRDYAWWNKANFIKEDFRQTTHSCIQGREEILSFDVLKAFLKNLTRKLDAGIKKAKDKNTGLYFTYFTYTVTKFRLKDKQIVPLAFARRNLPFFLEGIMHALKVEGKVDIHHALKKSVLFDKKIKMYRLNASLKNESLEIGRSRVFVPGWLENESIWLHMEYKYLLELLKKGFYKEFFADFYNCTVCFFDSKKYGRSILENSSFIVSSAYPDKDLWGKGFVARLSGATAEFLNIWILMCLGRNPFFVSKNKGFCVRFSPLLKGEFFTKIKETVDFEGKPVTLDKNTFSFKLFSKTLVTYHNPLRKDTFDKECSIEKIKLIIKGKETLITGDIIKPPYSTALRNCEVDRVHLYLK